LDCHRGLLFVPVEYEGGGPAAKIAVFRAATLAFVGQQELDFRNTRAGWCAVHPNGKALLVPVENAITWGDHGLFNYALDLATFEGANESRPAIDFLTNLTGEIFLTNECGNPLSLNPYCQGGEFSEDGKLLYLSSGDWEGMPPPEGTVGVTAFDARNWRKVTHSRNGDFLFNYQYGTLNDAEQPSGLTVWDLDRHPRRSEIPGSFVKGQLHVLKIASDNDFWLYHYAVDPLGSVGEALASFDAESAQVVQVEATWRIVYGTESLVSVPSKEEADWFLGILQEYGANQIGHLCRVPGSYYLQYFLTDHRAPNRASADPRVVEHPFDRYSLRLERGGCGWYIVDGANCLVLFNCCSTRDHLGTVEAEARRALKIIRKYGFTHVCWYGDGTSSLVYFRKGP